MKLLKNLTIGFASLLLGVIASHAEEINLQFGYQDPNGFVQGDASFNAQPLLGVPGGYQLTEGTLVLKAPAGDQITGTYQLYRNPNPPNSQYSPTGRFIYDNLLFPGSAPVVTNPGVLGFGGPGQSFVPEGKGSEVNFFSTGTHTYDLYTSAGGNYPYAFEFTVTPASGKMKWSTTVPGAAGVGTGYVQARVVAAPEPSTALIMVGFLLILLWQRRTRQV